MKTLCTLTVVVLATAGPTTAFSQDQPSLFDSLDANKDGVLIADEIEESQQRFFDRMVRAADANEDGKLSKAEYDAQLGDDAPNTRGPAAQSPGRDPAGRIRSLAEQMFDRLDNNSDGTLTRDEVPQSMKGRTDRFFKQAGKDELTKEEYLDSFATVFRNGAGPGSPSAGNSDRPSFFARLDSNNDGQISISELPEAMRPRMQPIFDRAGSDSISLESLEQMRGGSRSGDRRNNEDARPSRGEPNSLSEKANDGMERRRPESRFAGGRGGEPNGRFGPPAFITVLDQDEDGQITKSEALYVAKLFSELDDNGDEQLSVRELMGFGAPSGPPFAGRQRMQPESMTDESDSRSEEETMQNNRNRFDSLRRGGGPPERPAFNADNFFDRFDRDKNGTIERSELPERMAESMFTELDKDEDGSLSRDEFAKMEMRRRGGQGGIGGDGQDGNRNDTDRPQRPRRPEADDYESE